MTLLVPTENVQIFPINRIMGEEDRVWEKVTEK